MRASIAAAVVIVGWGIWVFFHKMGVVKLGMKQALLWACIGTVVVNLIVICVLLFTGTAELKFAAGCKWILAAALTSMIAFLAWLWGLKGANISTFAALCGLYPLVSAIMGVVFLKEKLTVTGVLGIILAVAAVFFLTLQTTTQQNGAT